MRVLRVLLAVIVVLQSLVDSLIIQQGRAPIDIPAEVVLTLGPGEPPFDQALVEKAGCYANRMKGYSLNVPGYAMGHQGENGVTTKATFINSSAIMCKLPPVITAGNTSIVLNIKSDCELALEKLCGATWKDKGAACWMNCKQKYLNQTKAAGCQKGDYTAFCGPNKRPSLNFDPGHVGAPVCRYGNYSCGTIEHFALFAPAVGRRPYIRETEGRIIVKTDYSLAGHSLQLSTKIAGMDVKGMIAGGRHAAVAFDMSTLPATIDELINISLTLPSGQVITRLRKFRRAPNPDNSGIPITSVQVDHESGPGLLMSGIPHTCNGWFSGGWDHESAGLPVGAIPGYERNNSNVELHSYYGHASMITQWARQGVTFTRSGIGPGGGPYLNDPAFKERKEELWKHQEVYLDAAASAGAYVLIQTGFDRLASCMSGWMEPFPHGCNPGSSNPCTGVAQKVRA
jgi:hypothetical protein